MIIIVEGRENYVNLFFSFLLTFLLHHSFNLKVI